MLEAQIGLVRAERDRLKRTIRFRLGEAVLRWQGAPWRLLRLSLDVMRLLRGGRAPWRPILFDRVPFSLDSVDAESPMLVELRRTWDEMDAIRRSPAYRRGEHLVGLLRAPWRMFRRSKSNPLYGAALPAPAAALPSQPVHSAAPAIACAGPDWFLAMASAQGLPREAATLLLAVESRSPPPPGPLPPHRKLVCWAIDGVPDPEWTDTLRAADACFAADEDVAAHLRETLGREVAVLAAAVQPLLQNPIGHWDAGPGSPASWKHDGDPLPRDWRLLEKVARTQDLNESECARVGSILGRPLATPAAPAWADEREGRLWCRKARLRRVWRDACFARRLAVIARAMDLPFDDAPPLASLLLCTNRPTFLPRILELVAAQTYPRIEFLLMLHGDRFDRADVDRRLAELSIPTTVFHTPQRMPKGESLQIASNHARGHLVIRIDDDDWYGPHYVEDFVLDAAASPAGVIVKACRPVLFEQTGRMILINLDSEYRYVHGGCGGPNMAYRPGVSEHVTWRRAPTAEDAMFFDDCIRAGIPIFSADRFGTAIVRRDPKKHTWQARPSHYRRHLPTRPFPRHARLQDFDV